MSTHLPELTLARKNRDVLELGKHEIRLVLLHWDHKSKWSMVNATLTMKRLNIQTTSPWGSHLFKGPRIKGGHIKFWQRNFGHFCNCFYICKGAKRAGFVFQKGLDSGCKFGIGEILDSYFGLQGPILMFCVWALVFPLFMTIVSHYCFIIFTRPFTHSHNPLTFDVSCRYKFKTPVVPLNL